jgi:hypothetical protein
MVDAAGSAPSPQIDRRDRRLAILLVTGGLLVQLPGLLWGIPGGKAINNALRILDGDVPYRDFWTMYAPGHFYLVAGIFKVFGTHVWTQGVAAQLLIAIDGALLFLLTRRLGLPVRPAVLIGAAFVLMQWGHHEVTSYETSLVFLIFAIDRVVGYAQARLGPGALIVAGLLCGAGAWFKHDVSFHIAFGLIAGLSLAWLMTPGRRPAGGVSPAGVLLRIGGGAAIAALPVIALLAWKAGPDAWRDLVTFPAGDFRVVRGEPYPPLLPDWAWLELWLRDPGNLVRAAETSVRFSRWIQANVPQILFAGSLVALVRMRRSLPPATLIVGAVCLAAMPLFWAAAHVQQNTHLISLWIFSVMLGSLFLTSAAPHTWTRGALMLLIVLQTGSFLINPVRQLAEIAYFWPDHATLDFPSVAGIRVPRDRYEVNHPIVSFIRAHVPESEPIYAGLIRHDSIVINNQVFYYLSGRRVASRYNEIHPGFVDLEPVQREIIADLNRLNVRCAVLWEFGWSKAFMDDILAARRQAIPAIGATVLDEFFRREFQEVARYGEYVLVWRKGIPMPPAPKS